MAGVFFPPTSEPQLISSGKVLELARFLCRKDPNKGCCSGAVHFYLSQRHFGLIFPSLCFTRRFEIFEQKITLFLKGLIIISLLVLLSITIICIYWRVVHRGSAESEPCSRGCSTPWDVPAPMSWASAEPGLCHRVLGSRSILWMDALGWEGPQSPSSATPTLVIY